MGVHVSGFCHGFHAGGGGEGDGSLGGGGMSRLPVGFSAVAVVFFSRNSQQVWGTFAPTRLCNDVTRESRSLSLCLCGYRSLRDAAGTLHTLRGGKLCRFSLNALNLSLILTPFPPEHTNIPYPTSAITTISHDVDPFASPKPFLYNHPRKHCKPIPSHTHSALGRTTT